jgi:two-component system chemotaxis sensor kinase CheA
VLFDELPEDAIAELAAPALPAPALAAPTPLAAPPEPPAPAPTADAPAAPRGPRAAAAADTTVRVSSEKLDRLVNLVGELVIGRSRLAQVASRLGDPELLGSAEEIERLVVELREDVLGVRMMPIGSTFGRFTRLVRDLSVQLGKGVDLVTEGADTELDKSVLDRLVEPLVHLIRNSVDHGIEPSEVRAAAGKPARGTVRLAARHDGQHVVITIEDDGKGLDLEVIRRKAVERGLIGADQPLTPDELHNLIFVPGFSTAAAVTDVSGRGVGMDVVRRQIEALRGRVGVTSAPGKGATLSLRLPLTLAIIDGLLVEIAGTRYIVPLGAVLETVELPAEDRTRHNGRRAVVVRGELVPYVSLRDAFEAGGAAPADEKVVILQDGGERSGIVVDRVLGEHQTVIQPLGRFYRSVELVSGATIMGDGGVALILDVTRILRGDLLRMQMDRPAPRRAPGWTTSTVERAA